jgi:hypothetical protein
MYAQHYTTELLPIQGPIKADAVQPLVAGWRCSAGLLFVSSLTPWVQGTGDRVPSGGDLSILWTQSTPAVPRRTRETRRRST